MERYQYSSEQRTLLENNPVPYAVYQFLNKRVVTLILSDGFCELFGYKDRALAYRDMDRDMYKGTHPDDVSRIADAALRFATDETGYDVVYRTKIADSADYRIIHAIGRHVYTPSGVRLAYVGYTDEGIYTEKTGGQGTLLSCQLNDLLYKESARQAGSYDYLTGLPGMTYFYELADAGKAALQKEGGKAVLLFLDLCGMKYYNTKYGFQMGDKLLISFAKLLSDTFSNENCSRISADHFAVYAGQERIESTLQQFFLKVREINGGQSVPVHVGIYVSGTEPITVGGAFDRAKMACDSLKNRFESCFCYYRKELISNKAHRQYILSNLDRAIEEKWIQVYYQGIVRAVTGKVSDEEALARWIDPERGKLSPSEFIPYLEDAGLIYKLDLYVLEQVLEKINLLKEKGLHVIPHSINLSRSDFDACDIVEEIRKRVDAAGVDRDRISVEITESTVGSSPDFIKGQVERFRALGFPVWMDDFGSGYSSFDVLQSIPFDLLKFDMSFMRKLDEGENGKIILTDLMRMATKLGLDTICEGVETDEQVRFLQEIGCAKLQGYYFSTPVPLSRVLQIVDEISGKGLENPEEEQYYTKIGRTNLYDFSDISSEDTKLQNVFSTLPMGILEITRDSVHYVRTNQSYRDLLKRIFNIDISGSRTALTVSSSAYNPFFMKKLWECSETGKPIMIDERLKDGTVIHSFARKISVNA
nr:EAL domain-containing protein [Oscillospiraceae bacterium]